MSSKHKTVKPDLMVLSTTQYSAYWRQGWVVVEGLFSAGEVVSWQRECDRVWRNLDHRGSDPRVQRRHNLGGQQVDDRIDPLLEISPMFKALSDDARLVHAVADLIGARPDVMKGKVIMKQPGTMGYTMHRDYSYYQFLEIPADEFVIATVALDVCDAQSGALEAFPDRLQDALPPHGENRYDVDCSQFDAGPGTLIELNPGDVALFHSLLPHRSAPNRSPHARRTLYFTYVKEGYRDIYARYHAGRPDPRDTQRRNTPRPD